MADWVVALTVELKQKKNQFGTCSIRLQVVSNESEELFGMRKRVVHHKKEALFGERLQVGLEHFFRFASPSKILAYQKPIARDIEGQDTDVGLLPPAEKNREELRYKNWLILDVPPLVTPG